MQGAIFGKHPHYGDFLAAGLSAPALAALEGWCESWLSDLRAQWGPEWPQLWAAAPPLRIWIGEAVAGEVICGVLRPSQDRVGRRYPLFALLTGADPQLLPDPPVLAASVAPYQALALACEDLPEGAGAAALAAALPCPAGAEGLAGPQAFWAERPFDAPPAPPAAERLLADVARADHRRAAMGRCYLWSEAAPGRPARFHAGAGLPAPQVMHWLLGPGAEAEGEEP